MVQLLNHHQMALILSSALLHLQVVAQAVLQKHLLEQLAKTVAQVVVLTTIKTQVMVKEQQVKEITVALPKVVATILLAVVVAQHLLVVVQEVMLVMEGQEHLHQSLEQALTTQVAVVVALIREELLEMVEMAVVAQVHQAVLELLAHLILAEEVAEVMVNQILTEAMAVLG